MEKQCKQSGCTLTNIKALGYCNGHYLRHTRGQNMTSPIRRQLSESERFWEKVDKTDSCWNWTGATDKGYGAFRYKGAAAGAHRVSYVWAYGPLPKGIEVDHVCHNRSCVNPAHLRPATKVLNGQNRAGLNRNNKSGVRGVHWVNSDEKWIAKGHKDGTPVHVGRFDSLEEAAAAIHAWRVENMPYSVLDQRKAA